MKIDVGKIALVAVMIAGIQTGVLYHRIDDLECQRDIYKSRYEDWEGVSKEIAEYADTLRDSLKARDRLDGKLLVEDAGDFLCTAYCTEKREHICGTGTGITASGAPVEADVTVAADPDVFPFGTVLYIEDAARSTGHEFDSRGEYDYYMGIVLPKVQSGEVVKVELHRRFTMLPEKEYGNVKLPAAHYTPDFVLTYADGTVEVVEVKSKFTRRQQRDYIHRRRMFIDLVAEPQHWRFIEHITPDTAEEIRKWKRLAEQAGKDSSWEKAGQGCQHSTGRASRMQ